LSIKKLQPEGLKLFSVPFQGRLFYSILGCPCPWSFECSSAAPSSLLYKLYFFG